jgi:iron complex transport system ATP-binding protein
MDEPFAGVDYGHQQRLVACLQNLASTGVGIVLTTHDPEQALHVSTRAALLVGGRIRDDGPPERVLTKEAIFSLYGVKVEVLRSAEGLAALCPIRCQSKIGSL